MTKIFSCSFSGLDCHIIEVQADIANGMPKFSIVGLGDTSVQESKERVRTSIKNSGFKFPPTRKTINLAPAEIKKQGSLFDLPIAVSILLASSQIYPSIFHNSLILGELSLNGELKAVTGILPITQHAYKQGFKKIFIPESNAAEASFIKNIEIIPIKTLKQLTAFSLGKTKIPKFIKPRHSRPRPSTNIFSNIVGHSQAKRALAISAAGGHNIIFTGPPGSGKTILARSLKKLLPPLSQKECLQTTKIFSIAGKLTSTPLINTRPFREVHHTASSTSIIGGGSKSPRPGEISLAHNGVLFFDEICEFPKKVLETLRQPLEDKSINITRANFSSRFPCRFIFLAAKNPCPCGFHGHKKCTCTHAQVLNYNKKLSGPILDRFDIFLNIENIKMKKIFDTPQESYKSLHQSIQNARNAQKSRFNNKKDITTNSEMPLAHIKRFCHLKQNSQILLEKAMSTFDLSNRAYLKTIRLARTIADLESSPQIEENHLAEALQYRT